MFPHGRTIAEYILCNFSADSCCISSRSFIPCTYMQIINLHTMLHTLISCKVSLQTTVQMTFHSGFNPKPIKVKRKKTYFQILVASEPNLALFAIRICSYSQIRLLIQFNFFLKYWIKCLYIPPITYPWIAWNSLFLGGKYFQWINDTSFQLLQLTSTFYNRSIPLQGI